MAQKFSARAVCVLLCSTLVVLPPMAQATPIAASSPTGHARTDAVMVGLKWGTTDLTFSAPTQASFYGAQYASGEAISGFDFLNEQQKVAMRASVGNFSRSSRLVFQEVIDTATTSGELRYAESSLPGTAWAYYPSTMAMGGDSWYNNARYSDPRMGNYSWYVFVHETGHAVGLKHPHTASGSFPAMPLDRDSVEYSVMSYRSFIGSGTGGLSVGYCSYPQSIMMYDISAQQAHYGANFDQNAGDTTYQWSATTGEMFVNGVGQGAPCGNRVFLTVWDGGGRDTFDLSNYANGVKVDLRPENWSIFSAAQLGELGGGKLASGNVANPMLYQNNPASLIEDVIGGAGADQITGNDANNAFTGNGGNDILDGGLGENTARYSGAHTSYQWQANGDDTWTISDLRPDSPNGTDTLRNIQWLAFANGTVAISEPVVVNRAPAALADTYAVDMNTTLNIAAAVGLLSNDSDPDGDRLSAVLVTPPARGQLSLREDGSFDYVPAANTFGTETFTYRASDGALTSAAVTVTINVEEVIVQYPPVAVGEAYAVNSGEQLNVPAQGLLANDTDANDDALTVVPVTNVSNGTLQLNQNGSFLYQSNVGYSGVDSFTYRVTDGVLVSNIVTVTITVAKVNRAPVAIGEDYTVNQRSVLNIAAPGLLTNDSDPDGDALTAAVVSRPANGSLNFNANGSFTFTPNESFSGADSFTYVVSDSNLSSNIVTVTITIAKVNRAPVASGESYSVNQGSALNIAEPGLLANDSDPDSDVITAVAASQPSNGSLSLNANGSFVYTPNASFSGVDSFTYSVSDGNLSSSPVTVAITVAKVNRAPVASGETYSVNQGSALNIAAPGLLTNDSDPDSDVITAVAASQPANGSLSLNANGSITYTPNASFSGVDSFTYVVSDGNLSSNAVTVAITVSKVNRAPIASGESYSMAQGSTLTIAAPGPLSNDSDPDGDSITAVLVRNVANGTLTLNANGSFTYKPNASFSGSDAFAYNVTDGKLSSGNAVVWIQVMSPNKAPVAVGDSFTVMGGTALNVAAPGLLSNDSDPNQDPLTVKLDGRGPSKGVLVLNSNGSFSYVPNPGFHGQDSFNYRANDGKLTSNRATVKIQVLNPNIAPVAAPDAYTTPGNTTLEIAAAGVLANDTDANGDKLIAKLVSGPNAGKLTLRSDGSFTYVPRKDAGGVVSFTYRASDGKVNSKDVKVTITVLQPNRAPKASSNSYSLAGTILHISGAEGVLTNDTDADGDSLSAIVTKAPTKGTLSLSADGSFVYQPRAGFKGKDVFEYKANDGKLNSGATKVTINVTGSSLQ